jgi:hypothetical protein
MDWIKVMGILVGVFQSKENMMKIVSIFLLCLVIFVAITQTTFSQDRITVSGIIFDAVTNKPLPYVNINLPGKNMGSVSNNDGYFIFRCPQAFLNDSLIISHIGYRSYSRTIRELAGTVNIIELEPQPIEFAKVVVLPVTGLDIVKEAIRQLPNNCQQDPFIMTGFYRELIREKQDLHKYAEGVISIYREMGNRDLIKLIKGRNRENLKAFAVHKKADPTLGGPMNCFYRDITNYPEEFFSKEYFEYYNYSIEGITRINNRPVYIISFDKKPEAKKGRYRGYLYIDRDSQAILKADYEYNDYGLKRSQPDPIQRSLAKLIVGITFESAGSHATVNYIEMNGQWYLKSVRYSIVDKLTRKKVEYRYTTEKELLISEITTENVNAFKAEELLDPKEEFSRQVGEYDEEFWNDYNIIKATESQRALIDDLNLDESE